MQKQFDLCLQIQWCRGVEQCRSSLVFQLLSLSCRNFFDLYCILLFRRVNIGGSDYDNLFLENGLQMTWFGGSRHYEDTHVIRRMLPKDKGYILQTCSVARWRMSPHLLCVMFKTKVGLNGRCRLNSGQVVPDAHNIFRFHSGTEENEDVLLFCRLPMEVGSGMAPYVFCGRVSYISHSSKRMPIEFLWKVAVHIFFWRFICSAAFVKHFLNISDAPFI